MYRRKSFIPYIRERDGLGHIYETCVLFTHPLINTHSIGVTKNRQTRSSEVKNNFALRSKLRNIEETLLRSF